MVTPEDFFRNSAYLYVSLKSMKGATRSDFYERFVVDDVKHIPKNPQRVVVKAASELGSLSMDKLSHPSFHVCKIDIDFKYNVLLETNNDLTDKVAFYMLDYGPGGGIPVFGDSHYLRSGSVSGGECYFAYSPSLNEIHQFDAQKSKPYYVEITQDYFNALLGEPQDKLIATIKEKIASRQFFGVKNSRLSAAHSRIISDMYNCPFDGPLGNLMMEGGMHQFVAIQLASYIQSAVKPEGKENISSGDKAKIHALKEYLESTFQENHSILALSRQFGINQNKLKKQFKELFGIPVIEYLYNLKMERARLMLYEKGMYVSEVAPIVGYKNSNHFATAFKRKFGVNPSSLKF